MKQFNNKKLWNWLTQFSIAYALATILIVILSLYFNGFDKAHIILEFNPLIRRLEIFGGIISFVVLFINFFIKFGKMAEQ